MIMKVKGDNKPITDVESVCFKLKYIIIITLTDLI